MELLLPSGRKYRNPGALAIHRGVVVVPDGWKSHQGGDVTVDEVRAAIDVSSATVPGEELIEISSRRTDG
jgi:hypothetical protein